MEQVNKLTENYKFPLAKLVNPLVFASVSPLQRRTDIKLQEAPHNIPKMTDYFIKLFSQLPNIVKTNGDPKDDGMKILEHAKKNLHLIRKKLILSGVSSEYKDLA